MLITVIPNYSVDSTNLKYYRNEAVGFFFLIQYQKNQHNK